MDNGKEKKSERSGDATSKVSGVPGVSRTILEILPELWEQQQYDDEYDLDAYLSTLKGDIQF